MAVQGELLRFYELRLLRCSLVPLDSYVSSKPASLPPTHRLFNLINDVVSYIEEGRYAEALSSEASRTAFGFIPEINSHGEYFTTASVFYSAVIQSIRAFISDAGNDEDSLSRALLVTIVGVASFLAFTQNNVTGPKVQIPWCPLGIECDKPGARAWEAWARNQLMESGSHLLGKFSNLQYIVFAKMLLVEVKAELFKRNLSAKERIRTITWWLARIVFLQQKMLDEKSSSLFDSLQIYVQEATDFFANVDSVRRYWGAKIHEKEASAVVCMFHTEGALVEHMYGRDDACRFHLELAESSCGLQLSVTGMLGFRTKYQTEPKAQRVLASHGNVVNTDDACHDMSIADKQASSTNGIFGCSHKKESFEMSDILMVPRLLDNHSNESVECLVHYRPLNGVQQLVILAQCMRIENNSRVDEMQKWDMAPYIEAINYQESSCFIIRYFSDMLRIRWESARSRTKERALVMLDNLVHDLFDNSPGVAQRMYLCFAVNIPTLPALQKEYADFLVTCGLVGEAIKIFEALDLWNSLIFCYCMLEKKAAAVELIKNRLSETPDDPSLWCSLGDVTNDDSCHEKALEISGHKSARAKMAILMFAACSCPECI